MIDWFTVVAQLANFLILVGLLRYFLYGRILGAIDRRQEAIRSEREEVARLRAMAQEELEGIRRERSALDQQREELVAEIQREVDRYREEKIQEVRAEVTAIRSRWAQSLADERESFVRELRSELTRAVCRIARHVLQSLADAELEEMIVRKFLQQFSDHAGQWRALGPERGSQEEESVVVRTSFPLSEKSRAEIEGAVAARLGRAVPCSFETSPDLVCGVSLHFDDQKIAWDVRDSLLQIEQELVRSVMEEVERNERVADGELIQGQQP